MRSEIRLAFLGIFLLVGLYAYPEDGRQAWLRYAPLSAQEAKQYDTFPSNLVVLGDSVLLKSAQQELNRCIERMLRKNLAAPNTLASSESTLMLGTLESVRTAIPKLQLPALQEDGYWLATKKGGEQRSE